MLNIDRHVRYGGRASVATSLPTVELKTLTLAQVDFERPKLLDVVFSIENLLANVENFSLSVPPHIDLGSGFVRITWGAGDVAQQVVELDPGRGWRQAFFAQSLKVEYVTVTKVAGVFIQPYPIMQKEDARIQASITPSISLPATPVYKSVFFADVLAAATAEMTLPRFATSWQVSAGNPANPPVFRVKTKTFGGVEVSDVQANSTAAQWPSFSGMMEWPIPSRATKIAITNVGGFTMEVPTIKCRLAL